MECEVVKNVGRAGGPCGSRLYLSKRL